MSAELALVQFIALPNLSFETADHLSDLFRFLTQRLQLTFLASTQRPRHWIHTVMHWIHTGRNQSSNCYSHLHIIYYVMSQMKEVTKLTKLLTVLVRIDDPEKTIITTRHLHTAYCWYTGSNS